MKTIILEGIDKAQRVLARYLEPKLPPKGMNLLQETAHKFVEAEDTINALLDILDNKDFVRAVNAEMAIMQDFQEDGGPQPQVPGPSPFIKEPIRAQPASVCSATASVIRELQQRSAVGLKKYGVSVGDRKDLTLSQWLKHLQEEMLDSAVYIEKVRAMENSGELERLRQENAALREQVESEKRRAEFAETRSKGMRAKIDSLKLLLNT